MGMDNKQNEKLEKIIDSLNKPGKLDNVCSKLLSEYSSSIEEKSSANEKTNITDKGLYLDQILLEKLMFKLEELQSQSKKYRNVASAKNFRVDIINLLKSLRVLSRNGKTIFPI